MTNAIACRLAEQSMCGSNLNGWISDHVEESASEFLAKVISGRRNPNVEMYFKQYPYKLEVPMTEKEYEAEVEKQKSE